MWRFSSIEANWETIFQEEEEVQDFFWSRKEKEISKRKKAREVENLGKDLIM